MDRKQRRKRENHEQGVEHGEQRQKSKTTPEKVGKFTQARMHAMTKPRLRLFGL